MTTRQGRALDLAGLVAATLLRIQPDEADQILAAVMLLAERMQRAARRLMDGSLATTDGPRGAPGGIGGPVIPTTGVAPR